ncbi:hypothetical protein C2S52_010568, partial [Perilla frutescens var. hirtella]
MAGCGDAWMQEYNEAAKLGEDIMISQRTSADFFALKRKILVFGTTIDTLEFHLRETEIDEELMNDRKKMIADLRSKMYELMPSTLNAYNRNWLLDLETNNANAITIETAAALDNSRILHLQRQTIRAQDEELEKLLETIKNTTDVAWAINQEFRLHQTLTVDANKYVEVPDSRLQ